MLLQHLTTNYRNNHNPCLHDPQLMSQKLFIEISKTCFTCYCETCLQVTKASLNYLSKMFAKMKQ